MSVIPKRLTPDRIKIELPEQKICPGCTQPVKKRYHTALWCESCDVVVRLHHACAAPKKLYYKKVKCPKCNNFFESAFINWAEKEARIRSYKDTWEKMEAQREQRELRMTLESQGKVKCFECKGTFLIEETRVNPYLTVCVVVTCKECYTKWVSSIKPFEELGVPIIHDKDKHLAKRIPISMNINENETNETNE